MGWGLFRGDCRQTRPYSEFHRNLVPSGGHSGPNNDRSEDSRNRPLLSSKTAVRQWVRLNLRAFAQSPICETLIGMPTIPVPKVLPTSPLSLWCPYCGAKPGKDCETRKGGFAVLHMVRVMAAALIDTKGREVRETAKSGAAQTLRKRRQRTP